MFRQGIWVFSRGPISTISNPSTSLSLGYHHHSHSESPRTRSCGDSYVGREFNYRVGASFLRSHRHVLIFRLSWEQFSSVHVHRCWSSAHGLHFWLSAGSPVPQSIWHIAWHTPRVLNPIIEIFMSTSISMCSLALSHRSLLVLQEEYILAFRNSSKNTAQYGWSHRPSLL